MKQSILILLLSISCVVNIGVRAQQITAFDDIVPQLISASFKEKSSLVIDAASINDERAEPMLTALLDGKLYYFKDTSVVVSIEEIDVWFDAYNILTGEKTEKVNKAEVEKIKVNNKLRKELRLLIAGLQLTHPDSEVRMRAIQELIDNPNEEQLTRVLEIYPTTKNKKEKGLMEVALNLQAIRNSPEENLDAIDQLSTRLEPAVRNALSELTEHSDPGVIKASQKAIERIDSRVGVFEKLETVFFGLSLGSILALAAIGLAITFGVIGVINMAHGELIMLGAYTTYVMQQLLPGMPGIALVVSIPVAFMFSGLVGILIERTVIRHLYGRPLETLLATFGISLVLQQAVRTVFSPLNRSVVAPSWLSGTMEINSVLSLTYNRMYVIGFCLAIFFVLLFIMNKTSLGLNVRAVSQNRAMARAMGIKANRVDMLTFGLGSGIAGIAGVALSLLTNVGPNLGQGYIIDSFMVVVFGGVGNLWGTLVSGFGLGIANKFIEPTVGAVMAKIIILIFIILFIQSRPRGLFPQRGRAVED